jgi:pilus assembly protein CpaE
MSLVIVAGDEALEQRVRAALPDGSADRVHLWDRPLVDTTDVKVVADQSPAVVVLGSGIGQDTAFELAAQLDRHYPGISVLVVATPAPDTWQRALAAGVRGLVARDASPEELRAQLVEAIEIARRRTEAAAEATAKPTRARVITVVSPKGGSGKTVVSTNLAVGLAVRHPGEVVLLDLDLEFGDVAYALALLPQHTIADAVSTLDDLDATLLKVFLTRHESGLYVLCAPREPAAGELIPVAATTMVIRLIASEFGHVVIDTPAGIREHTRAALDLSTDVVVVCDMDVPAVRDMRKALDLLGTRPAQRHVVLNRADSRVGLSKAAVVGTVGAAVDLEIPSSAQVPISLNEGRPLVLGNPRSRPARRLAQFAQGFEAPPAGHPDGRGAEEGGQPPRPGLLDGWRKRVSRLGPRG